MAKLGLYEAISSIISDKEEASQAVLYTGEMVERVKEEVDVDAIPREVLVNLALRQAVAIGLNAKGYRSVINGQGLYVNIENCEKREYLMQIYSNEMLDDSKRKRVLEILRNKIKPTEIPGQMGFDEAGQMFDEITVEELLEMLKKDAGVA